MTPESAVSEVNGKFRYVSDDDNFGFREVWRIMSGRKMRGDCEDYALTVLWLLADNSVPKMMWWLLTRKARIYHYKNVDTGGGHAGLRFDNRFVDNITRRWNDGSLLEKRGYKRKYAWPVVLILLKFIIGEMGHRAASIIS